MRKMAKKDVYIVRRRTKLDYLHVTVTVMGVLYALLWVRDLSAISQRVVILTYLHARQIIHAAFSFAWRNVPTRLDVFFYVMAIITVNAH